MNVNSNTDTNNANTNTTYYLRLIAAIFIWSMLYHIAKPAASISGPYLIAFLRYLIAALLSLGILKWRTGKFIPQLNKEQWLLVMLIGLIGICSYNLFFFNAEALISGNTVAILYAFSPCLTTIISSFVFKTKLNLLSKIGIVVSLLGAIGVVNYASPECRCYFCSVTFQKMSCGEAYGLLATIAFALYAILSKYTAQKNVSTLVMNTYASVFGCIFLTIAAIYKGNFTILRTAPLSYWLDLLYISVLATVVAYLWYTQALIKLGVLKTVIFQNTVPIQAVVIGYLFFGEKIGRGELVCGLIIVLGVYLTSMKGKRT